MGAARAVALAALILTSCAKPPAPAPTPVATDQVVVLPGPDGRTGTVVVERAGERAVLNEPYASSRSGQTAPTRLTEQEVRSSFGATLATLPARPASFLLYFVAGSDELTDPSKAELRKMLDELRQRPSPDILVIGHTDSVADDRLNDRLSLQRAERIRQDLVAQGIPADRIRAAGRGKRELLVPTKQGVDEPRNRRVEINVR